MKNRKPWAYTSEDILKYHNVDVTIGLTDDRVDQLKLEYGSNSLKVKKTETALTIFIRQFKGLLVLLLMLASFVSFMNGETLDAYTIVLVLFFNALIGFVMELKAQHSMESLKKMGQSLNTVVRDSKLKTINSYELVPGDLVLFEAGDVITADCRLIESRNLLLDESALTGESLPIEKNSSVLIATSNQLHDRLNMIMKGTNVTTGFCKAIVTAIGMNTELGKIAKLTHASKKQSTPLEKRLDSLANKLVFFTLFVSVLIFAIGVANGKSLVVMLQTVIALAVATVPEGLPIVATIALARGLWIMAEKNALIKKLSAVETLGGTNVIITDKTGTLTENKMTVAKVVTHSNSIDILYSEESKKILPANVELKNKPGYLFDNDFWQIIKNIYLCNNAKIKNNGEETGDPMELALLKYSIAQLEAREETLTHYKRIDEVPFDSKTKMMATKHKKDQEIIWAIKGAPESVIESSSLNKLDKLEWLTKNKDMSEQGLRVIAVAGKFKDCKDNDIYKDLIFHGLIGLLDPLRKEVPPAISKCKSAGIRVIMATGDQEGTAKNIAKEASIASEPFEVISGKDLIKPWSQSVLERMQTVSIFSRVSPEQKLDIVDYFQQQNNIVAMTGDGVNDAPALRKADIGIAMGLRGTQVARESSDMILKDDHFESIIVAIEQGRVIFANIRKFIVYLLSCNLSEILVVGTIAVIDTKFLISPLQILFLNLITDVFPALALGMGTAKGNELIQSNNVNKNNILSFEQWVFILFYALLITTTVVGASLYSLLYLKLNMDKVITIFFLTLGISQLFHVFNMRTLTSTFLKNDITENYFVWMALSLCLSLFVLSTEWVGVSSLLNLTHLNYHEWLLVILFSSIPLLGSLLYRFR